MIIEFIPEHFYLSHHPDGHRSSHGCHFLPNFHHFHLHPITNIGTSSFVAVNFVALQPRRVLSSWGRRIRHHVTNNRTMFVPYLSHSSHSLSPHYQHRVKIICRRHFRHISATLGLFILRLSHSSPYHQLQDYVHSVIITFISFTFTPLPTSGHDLLSLSLSSPSATSGLLSS